MGGRGGTGEVEGEREAEREKMVRDSEKGEMERKGKDR